MSKVMINCNGKLTPYDTPLFKADFRGHKYGDGLFETIRLKDGVVVFLEDHYFRLMASMRMIRMDIPMSYTMQHIENEILKTAQANNLQNARVRLSVYRDSPGLFAPRTNDLVFIIEVSPFEQVRKNRYTIDLFRDYYIGTDLLSTLKTSNRMINIVASIYASENNLDNCILLNHHKRVAEVMNGNIFMVTGDIIKTPPLSEGCIKGIVRKRIMGWLKIDQDLSLQEVPISPFELQKADEVFISNSIIGVQPITQYRKSVYKSTISLKLQKAIDDSI